MSGRVTFTAAVLEQHMAVLGKTGSGKTSTAKLAIEEAVAGGARVCILDPIKSDWWGLTSSRDGRKAGLPFHILGGPHGHVPLHSSAGKAVAEVVANGSLPLSIIDMADFEPGGPHRFFVDFAPTLLRKMRGVVYLVLEEAHLFAPKERSGIGQENLAIHWAKTLATAGRSKGIRLVLVTQRTQALHNALLGSCDTVIAHRLTAPADQDPVVKWLKANTSKDVLEQVAGSLSSLKTGEGWICAGEARLFERVHFPRIATYDNTATPMGQGETHAVTTAAVDAEQLRTLIGEAVEQAKQDDPRELRKQLADLRKQLAAPPPPSQPARPEVRTVEKFVLKDGQLARAEQLISKLDALADRYSTFEEDLRVTAKEVRDAIASTRQPAPEPRHPASARVAPPTDRCSAATRPTGTRASRADDKSGVAGDLSKGEQTVLTCVAQYPSGATREQISILTGYKRSTRDLYLQQLSRRGAIEVTGGVVHATEGGMTLLGPDFEPLPTGEDLIQYWKQRLPGGERAVFNVLVNARGRVVDREVISATTGYKRSTRDLYIQQLQRRKLVVSDRSGVRASQELFS